MTTSPIKIIAGYAQIDQDESALLHRHRAQYQTRLDAIQQLKITPTLLTIDPLSTDWHSDQQPNHFRSGCAPIMALKQAQLLIEQGHEAVIISGDDPVKSGYGREERHQLMSVYADDYSIAQLYNDLANEFIKENHSNEQQFLALADALFTNHSRSHKIAEQEGRAHFPAPGSKWFSHVTPLFRGVDCANPLVDFSGRLLLCSEALAQKINCHDDNIVNVTGIGLGLLDIDEVKQLSLIARYEHLTQAYQTACKQANLDLTPLITDDKVLMEIYTCYPVVPLAFLISSGIVTSLDEVPAFLDKHLLTITGGMNLARAPWNNPALNGLIEMYQQLISSSHQYGLVHGNGGIGYRQGIAILEANHR
ncbi:hypothetical protein [Neptunomonas qingdaonensis]|uniref:Acetyl-CoA C-acetyltransferase n=1 Tax=Neptunomonas qingdaonensis TaxID=1045558 RepID=A0A1I2Q0I7_9GAMM|nr:hypothetical protein [Neptunomonas qingdaonensis]SFG21410.1 hypothetical protein SAMN05216175_104147 [Neptunomonas qingdaonensis]